MLNEIERRQARSDGELRNMCRTYCTLRRLARACGGAFPNSDSFPRLTRLLTFRTANHNLGLFGIPAAHPSHPCTRRRGGVFSTTGLKFLKGTRACSNFRAPALSGLDWPRPSAA